MIDLNSIYHSRNRPPYHFTSFLEYTKNNWSRKKTCTSVTGLDEHKHRKSLILTVPTHKHVHTRWIKYQTCENEISTSQQFKRILLQPWNNATNGKGKPYMSYEESKTIIQLVPRNNSSPWKGINNYTRAELTPTSWYVGPHNPVVKHNETFSMIWSFIK